MFFILNYKNEFYSNTENGIEFTTDFAKAETFDNYADAYAKYRELGFSEIAEYIECM